MGNGRRPEENGRLEETNWGIDDGMARETRAGGRRGLKPLTPGATFPSLACIRSVVGNHFAW